MTSNPKKGTAAQPSVKASTKPAASQRARAVNFYLNAPQAQSVAIAGDFNNWNPTGKPLKQRKDGTWYATLYLAPGMYQYKFVLNGNEWCEDPARPERTLNHHGGYNSVCEVT